MNAEASMHISTSDALQQCRRMLRLSRAVELAKSKRYLEAEALLVVSARERLTIEELDLLARIAIRLKRYSKAVHYWSEAFKAAPTVTTFEELARMAEAAGRRAHVRRQILFGLAVALAAASAGIILGRQTFWRHGSNILSKPSPPPMIFRTTNNVSPSVVNRSSGSKIGDPRRP